jgi:RHS repeat-associated protein
LPFGETMAEQLGGGYYNTPYKFNGKELDAETGLYYYGARYYDPRVSIWMSVDPLAEKYPNQSPYSFIGGNPISHIEVDGRYWVGTNGKAVAVHINKDGSLRVGRNASADLKRMVGLINGSGSKTASEQFKKLSSNGTKINFKIEKDEVNNGLFGLHQAHDKDGKVLNWEGNGTTGKFSGTPEYITGKDGKLEYKEATMTVFEGNLEKSLVNLQAEYGNENLTTKQGVVTVFTHEGEHDLNQGDIKAIKERHDGGTNIRDVEKEATKIEYKAAEEVKNKTL